MAEQLDNFSSHHVSAQEIWLWRCSVWSLSLISSALRFHTPIGFPWTLNLFAIVAALWVEREIAYFNTRKAVPALEKMGEASYSVYLTHMHGSVLTGIMLGGAYTLSFWWLNLLVTSFTASVFYFGMEQPSHRLARVISGRFIWHQYRSAIAGWKRRESSTVSRHP